MNRTLLTSQRNGLGTFSILMERVSEEARATLEEATVERSYRTGERLFIQDGAPEGIFILRSGRVKLVASGHNGKRMLLEIAAPGAVLGLGSIAGKPYELTAECVSTCDVAFIPNTRLMVVLRKHPELGMMLALALSEDLDCAYERVRVLRSKWNTGALGRCRRS